MKIRKGDEVIVTKGKDAGKKGRVMRTFPKESRLLIEKINYQTVYLRPEAPLRSAPLGVLRSCSTPEAPGKPLFFSRCST